MSLTINPVNDPPKVTSFSMNGTAETIVKFSGHEFINNFHDVENDLLNKIKIVKLTKKGVLKLRN